MKARVYIAAAIALTIVFAGPIRGQFSAPPTAGVSARADGSSAASTTAPNKAPEDVLSPAEWRRVDAAIDRALPWLAAQQQPDGSFPTLPLGQPAVTSLCVLAFMAHGHNPGEGPYGARLEAAIDFVLDRQKENGLITLFGPEGPRISRSVTHEIGQTAAYNHSISSLMLSEVYGMSEAGRAERIEKAINKSLAATIEMQRWPKDNPVDHGGWRYVDDFDMSDSDMSITGWQLMFLRSARNAGFNVPKQSIDDAIGYVRRNFDRNYGAFVYMSNRPDGRSRGMAGAGILALGHAGFHNSVEAQRTGQWLLQYNFNIYNDSQLLPQRDRYHYSLFNSCQGMYQLGSPFWEQFFPRAAQTVLAHQRPEGCWDAESHYRDGVYGNSYTTALVLLSLGAPNQLLPVFQR